MKCSQKISPNRRDRDAALQHISDFSAQVQRVDVIDDASRHFGLTALRQTEGADAGEPFFQKYLDFAFCPRRVGDPCDPRRAEPVHQQTPEHAGGF
jgi:hypothetical protein